MNVFISMDIEGCAGIVDADQIFPGGPQYAEGRALMAGELNAAVEGALEAGARRIVVNDSHGTMRNLAPEAVHPSAELILGRVKTWSMIEGLDARFDAALFIGYHARAGTQAAVIAHTYSSAAFREVRVNGRPVGEAALNAAAAGAFGVPLRFLSGDRAAVGEIREWLPDLPAVAVKDGLGRRSARSVHPDKARFMIRQGVAQALRDKSRPRLLAYRKPIRLEVDLACEEMADLCLRLPGLKRRGPLTVLWRDEDYLEAYRALLAILTLSSAATR